MTDVRQTLELKSFSTKTRAQLADEGKALPDGSFPIENVNDLRNAIQAFGRAKHPDATKAFIIKRAKALGAVKTLPADWGVSEDKQSLNARVARLELAIAALGAEEFGDTEGHAFHGNQYTGGTGGALRKENAEAGVGVQKDGSITGGNRNATTIKELVTADQHKALDAAGFKFDGLYDHDRLVGFSRNGESREDLPRQGIVRTTGDTFNATWNEYRVSSRYGNGPVLKAKAFDTPEAAIKHLDKMATKQSWLPKS